MSASPRFVPPCSPTSAKRPPTGNERLHELKLDGYRFQVAKDDGQVRLYGRSGAEWTHRLPGFASAFLALQCRSEVLDGELVLPDEDGARLRSALVRSAGGARTRARLLSPSTYCTMTARISGHRL